MTIRPLVTAPPDIPTPSSNQGQLANLVLDAGVGAGVTSQPKTRGKKYHRRGKERRFGRGFRLIRNRHPFAEDVKVDRPSTSPGGPTVGPLQLPSSPPPQFANQVLSPGQQLLTTNTTNTTNTTSTNIPIVDTFDNQILDFADQNEVNRNDSIVAG